MGAGKILKTILISFVVVGGVGVGGYFGYKGIKKYVDNKNEEKRLANLTTLQIYTDETNYTEHEISFGGTFKLETLPDDNVEGTSFFGCYSEKDGNGEKYISSEGVSVKWEKDFPTKLYAYFVDFNNNPFYSKTLYKNKEYKIGGNMSSLATFNDYYDIDISYDTDYNNFVVDDKDYELTVNFDHYEATSSIFINWLDYKIILGSGEVIGSGVLSSIDKYRTCSHSYVIKGSSIKSSKGIVKVRLLVPDGNVAAKSSGALYKCFNFSIKPAFIYTAENISFDNFNLQYTTYADNGGIPLSGTPGAVTNTTTKIPIDEKIRLFTEKFNPNTFTVDFLIRGSGSKSVFLSNWVTIYVNAYDKDEKQLLPASMQCEINDSANKELKEFSINMTADQLKKTEYFSVSISKGGSLSAYLEAYFIYEQGISIRFPTLFTTNDVTVDSKVGSKITSYNYRFQEDVIIPEEYFSKTVFEIGDLAYHSEVKTVELPSSIVKIKNYAFTSWINLETAYINSPQKITLEYSIAILIFPSSTNIYLKNGDADLLEEYKNDPLWESHKDHIFLYEE